MKNMISKLRCRRGITLLELLVATALTTILAVAVLKTYSTQHKTYLVQEDIVDIQQNVRASIDEIGRHVRMAGFDLPTGMPCIEASNTNPDTITINYRTGNCDTYLSDPMPLPSSELKCATDISCFSDGDWVYIFEPDSGGGEWFEISHVQAAALHIQHNTMPLSKVYGADAIVMKINQVKYYVDYTSDTAHPMLMVKIPGQQAQIFADNITDLDFEYRMKNDSLEYEPVLTENIREVVIAVTGRSNEPDSDRPEDPYRTREFTTSVHLRNNEG